MLCVRCAVGCALPWGCVWVGLVRQVGDVGDFEVEADSSGGWPISAAILAQYEYVIGGAHAAR